MLSKKITKNRPTAGGPDPRPPSVIRLSYTGFLKTSPKLRVSTFQLYLFKPSAKFWLSANRQIFDDVIACDLWFRPPQSKILATPISRRLCEKLFLRPFFVLENTCGCVLGPWPRAFLSLASRGSVLGKAVLGLGLGFFCVLGLEPYVLDSTSAIVVFLCFGSYILQANLIQDKNRFKCTNEAAIGKSLEIANSDNN